MTSVQPPRPHLRLLEEAGGEAGVQVGEAAQRAFLHTPEVKRNVGINEGRRGECVGGERRGGKK